jgi:hypothetical protein
MHLSGARAVDRDRPDEGTTPMVSRLSLLALTATLMLAGGQAHAEKPAQRAAVATPLGAGASA